MAVVCGPERQIGRAPVRARAPSQSEEFGRCQCSDIDPMDPVSSDEVIEVHARLAKFEGSISELLHHSA